MKNRKCIRTIAYVILTTLLVAPLTGCKASGDKAKEVLEIDVKQNNSEINRSNEPKCLIPAPGGEKVLDGGDIIIDVTNSKEGYFYVIYHGDNDDVKMQIACNDGITYTYIIGKGDTVVPLTQGDGTYNVVVYEGMGNKQYSALFADEVEVTLDKEYSPYLYPNYYVNFDKDSEAVALGKELATGCTSDLEVIGKVYDYVIENITYDHDEALNVASDYVPDIDEILDTKKGICFDYASLMASMLRSQRIPTRLEVGYAGDAYHAWITTYIEDIGWINGIIQFDGADWTLMDPTFAANADSKTLEQFLGDGNNYTTKYIY